MTIVVDSFTGTDATLLTAHTGETGATWTNHPTATGTMQIRSNRLRNGASGGLAYASGTPATADYDVSAQLTLITDNNSSTIGVAGRLDTVANTKYWVRYLTSTNSYELLKTVAGASTSLGLSATTLSTTATITLRMRGSSISMLLNGVTLLGPVTDTAITAAGVAGVYGAGTSGDAVGVHLDDFSAQDANPLAGTITASSTVAGDVTVRAGLAGTVTSTSGMTGALTVARPLAGTVTSSSTASGAITAGTPLAGTVTASSTAAGGLLVMSPLFGTIAVASAVSGDLRVPISLAGTIPSVSALTADLSNRSRTFFAAVPAGSVTEPRTGSIAGPVTGVATLAGVITRP